MEIETIMALIALAAVVVGPAISLEIAKRQIRAQLVSTNRQKWIEELRSHVAQYVSEASYISTSFLAGKYMVESVVKANHLHRIVLLYLNPELDSHHKLWTAITDHSNYLTNLVTENAKSLDSDRVNTVCMETGESADNILKLAHACLKIESELIKRGE